MADNKTDNYHTAYDGIDKALKFLSEGGITEEIRKFYLDKSEEELNIIKEKRLMPAVYNKD